MNCQLKIIEKCCWLKRVYILLILLGINIASVEGADLPDPILLPADKVNNAQPFACYYGNTTPIGGSDYGPLGTEYKSNVSPVNINIDQDGVAELDFMLSGGSKNFAVCKCGVNSGDTQQLYFTIPNVTGGNIQIVQEGFGNGDYSIRVNDDEGNAVAYVMPYLQIYTSKGEYSYLSFSELYQKTAMGNNVVNSCDQIFKLLGQYNVSNASDYTASAAHVWMTMDYRSAYGSKFLIKFANNVQRSFSTNFKFDLYMGFGKSTGYVLGHPFATFDFNLDINPTNQCTTTVRNVDFGTLSQIDIESGVSPQNVEVFAHCNQFIGSDTLQLSFDAERSSLFSPHDGGPVVKLTNVSSGNELNLGVLILGEDANSGTESNMLSLETEKRIDGELIVAPSNPKPEYIFNFTAQLLKLNNDDTEIGAFSGYARLMLSYK